MEHEATSVVAEVCQYLLQLPRLRTLAFIGQANKAANLADLCSPVEFLALLELVNDSDSEIERVKLSRSYCSQEDIGVIKEGLAALLRAEAGGSFDLAVDVTANHYLDSDEEEPRVHEHL